MPFRFRLVEFAGPQLGVTPETRCFEGAKNPDPVMTSRVRSTCVLTASALLAWIVAVSDHETCTLVADPTSVTDDSDGDFVPDVVEWACLSNANAADTDVDGVPDFVEIVQRANPQQAGLPLPSDHELRIVVTALGSGSTSLTNLHLLFRFMGEPTLLTQLDTFLELGWVQGARFSLSSLAAGQIIVRQQAVPGEGLWVHVSVPLASEAGLRSLMPCTIGADAQIGTRLLRTRAPLFDYDGLTSTIVPFARNNMVAVQSIGAQRLFAGGGSNEVCVMRLRRVGSGDGSAGGDAFRVEAASCEPCNDLQCGAASCSGSVGRVFVLPGGLEVITGN